VFVVNLVVAFPPEGWTIPETRLLSIAGAVVITAIAGYSLWLLIRGDTRAGRPYLA